MTLIFFPKCLQLPFTGLTVIPNQNTNINDCFSKITHSLRTTVSRCLYKTFRKDLGIQLMINISKLNRMKNPNPTATTPFFRQIHWPFPAHPAIFQTLKFFAPNDVKIRVLVSKCHFIWTISPQKTGLVALVYYKTHLAGNHFYSKKV